ncbi:hypothetical protein EGW08_000394 [Elysia chlorotica]|uniref:Secreted protein n=1 Tax=Elysia chlorotica TaxID=188477 RepID=A0A433UDM6_ELYCH|nr:hypothetical protein EGW08_000394 [Elysia chlorotica]
MARLTITICLGLLCVAVVFGRGTGGHGGSGGRGSQGGSSERGSSEEDVTPITKDEFHALLTKFAEVFKKASDGMGEIESAAKTAKTAEDWAAFAIKFGEVIESDLKHIGPAVEHIGETIERIAASPDDFTPIPYCDESAKLAKGQTPPSDEDKLFALIEDLGCFKEKLLAVTAVDADAVKKTEYTEREALDQIWSIMSEVVQMGTAFGRFAKALEGNAPESEESNNGGGENSDISELVRLLKQLNLGSRRK